MRERGCAGVKRLRRVCVRISEKQVWTLSERLVREEDRGYLGHAGRLERLGVPDLPVCRVNHGMAGAGGELPNMEALQELFRPFAVLPCTHPVTSPPSPAHTRSRPPPLHTPGHVPPPLHTPGHLPLHTPGHLPLHTPGHLPPLPCTHPVTCPPLPLHTPGHLPPLPRTHPVTSPPPPLHTPGHLPPPLSCTHPVAPSHSCSRHPPSQLLPSPTPSPSLAPTRSPAPYPYPLPCTHPVASPLPAPSPAPAPPPPVRSSEQT